MSKEEEEAGDMVEVGIGSEACLPLLLMLLLLLLLLPFEVVDDEPAEAGDRDEWGLG